VQSVPKETALASPELPFAKDVWVDMIRGAKRRLEFAHFYITNRPGSALEPVLQELEKAAARGVKVRFLLSSKMLDQDPASVARLRRLPGAEVQTFSLEGVSSGILHAKYFLVDGKEAFLGSQNFDWRALEHIHEMGVRSSDPAITRPLARLFEVDWRFASDRKVPRFAKQASAPVAIRPPVELVASPPFLTPPEIRSALPALVELLAQARQSIRVQLLVYSPVSRKEDYWPMLDVALRAAAVRGVSVRLLVSDWSLGSRSLAHLKSLALIPNLEVRIASVPEAQEGHIPYARTIHSKYLVVDDSLLWLGTSNWEADYFTASRNIELIFRNPGLAAQGGRVFDRIWNSGLAFPLEASRAYEKRKID
jgi:phosphatidylserine/phosphatidylglycerophosphate/cardiolipin synthase-like enzyme